MRFCLFEDDEATLNASAASVGEGETYRYAHVQQKPFEKAKTILPCIYIYIHNIYTRYDAQNKLAKGLNRTPPALKVEASSKERRNGGGGCGGRRGEERREEEAFCATDLTPDPCSSAN